jgi:hypothetical protein
MSEHLDPLPPDIAELFAEERGDRADALAPAARDRLRVRLAALGPVPVPVPAAPAGAAAAKGAIAAKIGIAAIAFGIGGVSGAAVHAMLAKAPPPAPVVTASVSAETAMAPPSVVVSANDLPDAVAEAPSAHASAAPPPSREDRLKRERSSLEVARTALTRGDFSAALAAIDRHSREFPRGQLAEERESMRIQALVGLGRGTEAREQAARFRRDFPGSMLQGTVDAALSQIR